MVEGSVTAVGPSGTVSGFPLSLGAAFRVRTDATATSAVAGIAAWIIVGDRSAVRGTTPGRIGEDVQAQTLSTLAAALDGVASGHRVDQATKILFVQSCAGVAACALAGDGQPYVAEFSGMARPSEASTHLWHVTREAQPPPPGPPR